MADKEEFNRQVRRTAFLTFGLAAALVFGIIVLVTGDWIPGTITVAAALIGLAKQVTVIRRPATKSPRPRRRGTRQPTDAGASGRRAQARSA